MNSRTCLSRISVLALAVVILSVAGACAAVDEPAKPVHRYYQALAENDRDSLEQVVCAEFLDKAMTEFDSFGGVKVEATDLACKTVSQDESSAQVSCTGHLTATYGSEKMDFPLDERVHTVVKTGSDWLLCGY